MKMDWLKMPQASAPAAPGGQSDPQENELVARARVQEEKLLKELYAEAGERLLDRFEPLFGYRPELGVPEDLADEGYTERFAFWVHGFLFQSSVNSQGVGVRAKDDGRLPTWLHVYSPGQFVRFAEEGKLMTWEEWHGR